SPSALRSRRGRPDALRSGVPPDAHPNVEPNMSRRPSLARLDLLALLAALSLSSCAILSPPEPRSGGDGLSDAAKETAKKPADQKPLVAGDQVGESGSAIGIGLDL